MKVTPGVYSSHVQWWWCKGWVHIAACCCLMASTGSSSSSCTGSSCCRVQRVWLHQLSMGECMQRWVLQLEEAAGICSRLWQGRWLAALTDAALHLITRLPHQLHSLRALCALCFAMLRCTLLCCGRLRCGSLCCGSVCCGRLCCGGLCCGRL
jgi:hypothetical protein